MPPSDLYQRLGGSQAIRSAVDIFYERVLADPVLRPFFETTDMSLQRQKQARFLAYAFGAPTNYEGKDMRAAHQPLDLDDGHFDAVLGHLTQTLRQIGVGEAEIEAVAEIARGTRTDVLNR